MAVVCRAELMRRRDPDRQPQRDFTPGRALFAAIVSFPLVPQAIVKPERMSERSS
jgi:hypothetical protein